MSVPKLTNNEQDELHVAGPKEGQQDSLYAHKHSKLDAYFGFALSSMPGVILAGAVYPIVILFILLVVELFQYGLPLGPPGFGIEIFGYLLVAFIVGGVFAFIVGLFAHAIVTAINWLLNYPFSALTVAGAGGGLTGFACTGAYTWHLISGQSYFGPRFELLEALAAISLGPLLATLMGQLGATWFLTRFVDPPTHKHEGLKYQFRIPHMFAITAIVAVVFGLGRLIPFAQIPLLVFVWCVLQSITSYSAYYIRNRRSHSVDQLMIKSDTADTQENGL